MSMGERSMMWRTTIAFGALCVGSMLAYLAFQLGIDAERGALVRAGAIPLLFGAYVCAVTAARELRGDPVRSRR